MEDTKEALLRRIEEERMCLNAAAERGLDHPELLIRSEKIDALVAQYYQILKAIESSDFSL